MKTKKQKERMVLACFQDDRLLTKGHIEKRLGIHYYKVELIFQELERKGFISPVETSGRGVFYQRNKAKRK